MRRSLCLFSLFGLLVCARTWTTSVAQEPANYELHRPVYHLTPAKGHNNDVNGLFFDARHQIYHAFVQYANITSGYPRGSPRRAGWYHFTSKVQISVETIFHNFHLLLMLLCHAHLTGSGALAKDWFSVRWIA